MTIILLIHIALMILSLTATSVMTIAVATSRVVNKKLITLNLGMTTLGIACGALLLSVRPLDMKCAMLFGYVLAFAIAYLYISRQNQSLVPSES